MPNPTPLISMPPEHAAAGEYAICGNTNDDEAAGALCHYSATASRAPPRLELEVHAPLLRLIKFMRSVIANAADAGDARAELEEQGGPERRRGRRRLGRVPVRSAQSDLGTIFRTDELDIAVKFQYKKPKKIVLQTQRGHDGVFTKINILCSKIQAMETCFDDAGFNTLRIQVKSKSEQYLADRPPAGRHRQWRRLKDIEPGTFCLQCEKGSLERSFGKMLYTDPSLILLTLPPASIEEDEAAAQARKSRQTRMT